MNDLLIAQRLTKTYGSGPGALTVLRDVDFALREGATCAIVGPSGSGKTTLLGLCAGLDRPSSGRVVLAGEDLDGLDEDARAALRARAVGFVFQGFRLLQTLTALENVRLVLELRGEAPAPARAQAAALLERVGLGGRLDHYPAQLSGGEQQRVAFARAFVHRPAILFADEPTGNLDGVTGHAIVDLLFDLHQESNSTLVLVTHDLGLAARCERVLTLEDGRLVKDALKESAEEARRC